MAYPKDWRDPKARAGQDVGHQEGGKTVGVHSLAVLPRLHRCGLGQMVMKAFLDQMKNSGLVDRVALICQDVRLHPFVIGRGGSVLGGSRLTKCAYSTSSHTMRDWGSSISEKVKHRKQLLCPRASKANPGRPTIYRAKHRGRTK
jgi:GNAT superfamily N-acetyltransferase